MEIVRKSRALARQYNLNNYKLLYQYTLEELRKNYNGCGACYFPAWVRTRLDKATRAERPAFLIHDVEFARGGDLWEYVKSNLRLIVNCWKCASRYYSAGSPFRWHHKKLAFLFGFVCLAGGWAAWNWRGENLK